MTKIINSGDINNKSLAGGLIGNIPEFGTTIRIEQCITLGTVETDIGRGCGGLVGGQNKKVTINRCAALQETVKTSGYSAYVGRIFGYGYGGNYVNGEKNYAYAGMSGGANGTFAAYEAVNGEVPNIIYIPVAILGIALILIGFFKDKFKQENFDL